MKKIIIVLCLLLAFIFTIPSIDVFADTTAYEILEFRSDQLQRIEIKKTKLLSAKKSIQLEEEIIEMGVASNEILDIRNGLNSSSHIVIQREVVSTNKSEKLIDSDGGTLLAPSSQSTVASDYFIESGVLYFFDALYLVGEIDGESIYRHYTAITIYADWGDADRKADKLVVAHDTDAKYFNNSAYGSGYSEYEPYGYISYKQSMENYYWDGTTDIGSSIVNIDSEMRERSNYVEYTFEFPEDIYNVSGTGTYANIYEYNFTNFKVYGDCYLVANSKNFNVQSFYLHNTSFFTVDIGFSLSGLDLTLNNVNRCTEYSGSPLYIHLD